MKINIREILHKDHPFVLNLASETVKLQISPVRQDVTLDSVRENYMVEMRQILNLIKILRNYKFLIATSISDEPLGYLLLDTANNELVTFIPQGWIFDFSVSEPYWESSVPARLVSEAEKIAKNKGLRHIALRVSSSNERAIKFFISCGYEIERKRFYKKLKQGEDRKVLQEPEKYGFILRPGKISDVPFMTGLIKENLEALISPLRKYSEEEIENCRENFCNELESRIETGHLVSFVAEEVKEKNLLGFFLVEYNKDFLTGQGETYVNNIIVKKNFMGKWVSNKLGKKIEEYADSIGIFILSADIVLSNRRSIMFTTRYFRYDPEQVGLLKLL